MADLTYICKRKLLNKLWEELPKSWKILIVDKYALKVISSFCGMDDLLNADILDVNNLEKKREPFMCPALYLISPTKESVDTIIKEFEDVAHPQYSSAYVGCINAIDKSMFDQLKGTPRIKDVRVIPLDFLTIEQRVFSLNNPNAFYSLYSKETTKEEKEKEIEKIGKSLSTLLYCLNINPVIRYINKPNEEISEKIVEAVQKGYGEISGCPVVEAFNPAEKTTRHLNLIIADRMFDLITPLMTEFTYQAMVYDCLEVKKDRVEIESKSGKKTMVLEESDKFWRIIRHEHIANASPYVVKEFNKFISEHKGLSGNKGAKDMKQMGEMMKQLPEYMDLMSKFSNHMELITQCFNQMKEKKLDEFATGEQIMGTGSDVDGKEIKKALPYITSAVGNITFPIDRRLREVLIYLFSQEYSEADKNALIGTLRGDERIKKIIENGMTLPKTQRERNKSKKSSKEEKEEFDLSRYKPFIKEIVERMANNEVPEYCVLNKLDFAGFPVNIEQKTGNITVAAGKSLKKQKAKEVTQEGQLGTSKTDKVSEKELLGNETNILVIFITGAISYSEMRVAYELSEKLKINVFIGSNYIATQNHFVTLLESLSNPPNTDISSQLL
ncbi:syntaxin binding protein [Entamoeba histolytica HM-3:IMSS]|uniref:Syntaxin binding protein, putative n=5 Tax=Entamoeba histolytica TaxID=5759 RepID=A0A8U0WPZ7_ENTH1|eukprot:XP_648080.1 syntaxin binding protein, putative [Entamoeba histolytica HM-1:IMSS]